MTNTKAHVTEATTVTSEEGASMLNRAARRWLNMSGADFLRRWDAGEFRGDDRLAVQQVAMLVNFARA